MHINREAPVIATAEVQIGADVPTVWSLLTDIEDWPVWNADVRWTRMYGAVAPGTKFVWRAGPGRISSTIEEVRPRRELTWSGSSLGVRAVHVWRLYDEGDHTTLRTEESWDGFLPRLLRRPLRRLLQDSVESGLQQAKAEAHRRAVMGEGGAPERE